MRTFLFLILLSGMILSCRRKPANQLVTPVSGVLVRDPDGVPVPNSTVYAVPYPHRSIFSRPYPDPAQEFKTDAAGVFRFDYLCPDDVMDSVLLVADDGTKSGFSIQPSVRLKLNAQNLDIILKQWEQVTMQLELRIRNNRFSPLQLYYGGQRIEVHAQDTVLNLETIIADGTGPCLQLYYQDSTRGHALDTCFAKPATNPASLSIDLDAAEF